MRALTLAWLLLLFSIPLWMDNLYVLHVLIVTGIFIIAAMSLNVLLGFTGQLSLGQTAAVRAYIERSIARRKISGAWTIGGV